MIQTKPITLIPVDWDDLKVDEIFYLPNGIFLTHSVKTRNSAWYDVVYILSPDYEAVDDNEPVKALYGLEEDPVWKQRIMEMGDELSENKVLRQEVRDVRKAVGKLIMWFSKLRNYYGVSAWSTFQETDIYRDEVQPYIHRGGDT